jgi:hypothetical protein
LAAKKKAGPPKPSLAHRKLAYFAGKWRHEGEIKPSPFGPAGKFTYTETCEWFAGGFALVCRSEGDVPEGKMEGLSILGWDAAEKSYVYFEINSTGELLYSRGTARGKIWTSKNASKRLLNGKPVRTRLTLTQVSRDVATYKFEMAAPRQPLKLVMTGKQTRIG